MDHLREALLGKPTRTHHAEKTFNEEKELLKRSLERHGIHEAFEDMEKQLKKNDSKEH